MRKGRLLMLMILAMVCITLLVYPAKSNAVSDHVDNMKEYKALIKKAAEYRKAKMFNEVKTAMSQAISCLDQEIKDNPLNTKAHFLLARHFLQKGDYRLAGKRVNSIIGLNHREYRQKVGYELMKCASDRMPCLAPQTTHYLFKLAIKCDPRVKKIITRNLYSNAKKGQRQALVLAVYYVDEATKRNEIKVRILNMAKFGKRVDGRQAKANLSVLEAASMFSQEIPFKVALRKTLSSAYVLLAKHPGLSKTDKEYFKNKARQILSEKEFKLAFPYWKTVHGSKKTIIGKIVKGTFAPRPVAKYGDEIKIGYRMVLTAERKDQDFYVSIGGKWVKKTGSWTIVNQYPGKGEVLQVLVGEGVKLNWELQEHND